MADRPTVAVVGAGIMGNGLATHFTLKGCDVVLIDHRQSNLDEAGARILDAVEFLRDATGIDANPDDVLSSIELTLDQDAGVADADIVLESVSENLDIKHKLFEAVAAAAPDDAVLASNTSSIQITNIADAVPDAADRVVGCHWWNPPYLMPLVEIVRGEETSDETVDRAVSFVESVDRNPIVVNRDVPGFVWNRIQFAVLREAMHIVDEGIASIEDVDAAVRDGYALRTAVVGPFETVDLSGLDLFRDISNDLYPHLNTDEEASNLFDEYIDAGRNGVEDGAGFYEYDRPPQEVLEDRDRTILALREARGDSSADTQDN
ncbi:3-hydroxyacyl-CoA dehydrogenase family protein [Natronosalvus rutilus]|uniref:3-hydroxyacyl-CoA dehydrogenase family protein n=1 Tax=Natronosalvus rutilus TaxID=2953753 RepID=A0A9E7SX25_9EURY|nr:3-hydroxyacyl-CoA dehydrogenase family protein [Natronosalvus rutilus]UTF55737.1 3-hydroxyacyl-CoA dehydrogenase family protein [Natronosalvus rutilus]